MLKAKPRVRSASPLAHVRAMLREQLKAVRTHEPGTRLGTDPEELHQLRVAVRRMRAILRVARPMFARGAVQRLRAELAWLGRALGHVRDLDVIHAYLEAELASLPPLERRAGRRLLQLLAEAHAQARRGLLQHLDDRRYSALLDRLAGFVKQPAVADAKVSLRDLAAREFTKLSRMVEALPEEPSDTELHAVRIQTKRARYAAELTGRAVGRPAERFVKRAKKLQDALGEHRDAVVAEGRLRELLGAGLDRQAAFVAGRLAERQRARRLTAREAATRDWRKLERRGRRVWK